MTRHHTNKGKQIEAVSACTAHAVGLNERKQKTASGTLSNMSTFQWVLGKGLKKDVAMKALADEWISRFPESSNEGLCGRSWLKVVLLLKPSMGEVGRGMLRAQQG